MQEEKLQTFAKEMPMVPVPQQMSSTVLSWLSSAHSPMAVYSTSAACVFTWEIKFLIDLLLHKQ